MPFEPHGEYSIFRRGDIIVIRFLGSWNLPGAQAFMERYKTFVAENGMTRFGVLSDLSGLEGGTPDGIEYFQRISDWAQENGQAARAMILDSALKNYIIRLVDAGKDRFPSRIVADDEEAFAWFEGLGLSTG